MYPDEIIIVILGFCDCRNVNLRCCKQFDQLCTFVFYDQYKQQFLDYCFNNDIEKISKIIHLVDMSAIRDAFNHPNIVFADTRIYLINHKMFDPYFNNNELLFICIKYNMQCSFYEIFKKTNHSKEFVNEIINKLIETQNYTLYLLKNINEIYPHSITRKHVDLILSIPTDKYFKIELLKMI
jgi:hypothetical protein